MAHALPSRPAPSIPVTPEAPGRYERRDLLGIGGIGLVELAWDHHLGREVAIKRLRPGRHGDSVRRFLKEARIGATLAHPNIVPVYELGARPDGTLYYTMKRVQGQTLAQALDGADLAGRLALLPHLVAVAHAMAYAHERGILHRDLKPDNVMIGAYGATLVVDWGLACELGADDVQSTALAREIEVLRHASGSETVTGAPIGTPAYMPPEQARGDLDAIDARSDVYALGAMLFEILTGEPPFSGRSALQILTQVLSEPVFSPQSLEPAAPEELSAIAMRALAKDPADRYPDAAALVADLGAFQSGGRVSAHAYRLTTLARRWVRRHRPLLAGLGLLAAFVGGSWWFRGETDAAARAEVAATLAGNAREVVDQTIAGIAAGEAGSGVATRLAALGATARGRLDAALDHPDERVRREASDALGGLGAVGPLAARLAREPVEDVRVALVQALAATGDVRAEAPVAEARRGAAPGSLFWRRTAEAYARIPAPAGAPAAVLLAKGRVDEARRAFDAQLAEQPGDVAAWRGRSQARLALGDLVGALADLDAALARAPDDAAARLARGRLRHQLEDYDGALADLARVSGHPRLSAEARLAVGEVRYVLGDQQAARVATRHLGPAQARGRGALLLALGDHDAALAALSQALARDGRDAEALRLRARLFWQRGEAAAALVDARQAAALEPRHPGGFGQRVVYGSALGLAAPEEGPPLQRGSLIHAPGGDFEAALRDLDVAAEGAGPLTRPLIGLLALAVAARVEAPGAFAERARRLPRDAALPWHRDLLRVVRGAAEPRLLGGRLRHHRARPCERALALSLRARLRGDRVDAEDRLASAATLGDPAEPACAVARSLSHR